MNQTRQRPDDQHVMPVEASRRGAHRARVGPALGALPFLAVAVVVVGVVALAWTLFGGGGGGTATPGVLSTAGTPTGAASTAATSAAPTKQPSATKPAASSSSAPTAGAEPTVDKDAKIVVRNSTSTGGLARKAAARLETAGWTINGIPDNFRPRIDSTVFYADDDQSATATAVAADLGIERVEKNADNAPKGVTVILGSDWTP